MLVAGTLILHRIQAILEEVCVGEFDLKKEKEKKSNKQTKQWV